MTKPLFLLRIKFNGDESAVVRIGTSTVKELTVERSGTAKQIPDFLKEFMHNPIVAPVNLQGLDPFLTSMLNVMIQGMLVQIKHALKMPVYDASLKVSGTVTVSDVQLTISLEPVMQ